ncbi:cuticle protein 19-like [Scylla paramamosain]|uniref:cuticle protein 19-like n=1 Tax=Scylla paramamosain TaxID=85552 RepID=UPI00308343CB
MAAKVLLLLALVAAASAASTYEIPYRSYDSYESYESEEPNYNFRYVVKDYYGNDFGHRERRNGDYTEGTYYNQLPDGRYQTVKYVVDGYSGFVADVSYEGEAHYDSGSYESSEHYRPTYDSGSQERYRPRYDSESHEYYRPSYRYGYSG